jgi:hypothetical protein
MMSGKNLVVVGVVLISVLVVGGLLLFRGEKSGSATSGTSSVSGAGGTTKSSGGVKGKASPTRLATGGGTNNAQGEALEDEESLIRSALAPLQEDLDSSDPKKNVAAARKLMGHENARLRLKAVEALAWAEADGFADLSKMLLDQDKEVSRTAFEAWAQQVQSLESSDAKVALIKEVGDVALSKDAETFQEVLNTLNDVPDAQALALLQNFASKTDDLEKLEGIYDGINFHASPEENVKSKADIPKAMADFAKHQAEEAGVGGGVVPAPVVK